MVYNPANKKISGHHHEHSDVSSNPYPKLSESLASADAKFPELLAKSYPRILQRIELLWGSKEASNYLNSIFLGDSDDRVDRQGFPVEILKEIVHLKQMHDFLFPAINVNPYDPFSGYTIPAPTRDNTESGVNSGKNPAISLLSSAPARISPANPAASKPAERHIDWPIIRSQRELNEKAEQWQRGINIYPVQGKPIEEILLHYELFDARAMRVILRMQERHENKGKSIDRIIIEAGIIRQDELLRAQCVQAGILMVDILNIIVPPKTLKLISSPKAREKQVMPAGIYNDILFLAVADPFQFKDHQSLASLTGFRIVPVFAPRHEIVNRLNTYK